jgi:hypothetical protein
LLDGAARHRFLNFIAIRLIAVSFSLQWLALVGLSKWRLLIGTVAAIS